MPAKIGSRLRCGFFNARHAYGSNGKLTFLLPLTVQPMFKVLTCVTSEHNPVLVGLAGLICFIASYCASVLLERGYSSKGAARWVWLVTAGASGGFGIWTTNFVAMLAYEPGVVVGYHQGLTLLSLLIAMLATTAATV